jgi:phosphatidylethanolamine-binding protein (PEBP) family uncharacterized protein
MNCRLWSNDLKEGGRIPEAQVFNGMGYSGGNRSPHLAWDGVPQGTKSFVLTCGHLRKVSVRKALCKRRRSSLS